MGVFFLAHCSIGKAFLPIDVLDLLLSSSKGQSPSKDLLPPAA
jgi:hypothetical protein